MPKIYIFRQNFFFKNRPKPQCLCSFKRLLCYYNTSLYATYNSCCFHIFTPFLYSKNVPKTQYLCGVSVFSFCSNQASFHPKSTTLPRSLSGTSCCFLFFVSITLFVEIMSRISNCFFNFKLRCEKGDDGFCHRPLGLISIYLLLAILLFLSTTVSVITAPPLMKRSAIQRNIWLLSPVAGEFAFAWTLKVPSVLPSV